MSAPTNIFLFFLSFFKFQSNLTLAYYCYSLPAHLAFPSGLKTRQWDVGIKPFHIPPAPDSVRPCLPPTTASSRCSSDPHSSGQPEHNEEASPYQACRDFPPTPPHFWTKCRNRECSRRSQTEKDPFKTQIPPLHLQEVVLWGDVTRPAATANRN